MKSLRHLATLVLSLVALSACGGTAAQSNVVAAAPPALGLDAAATYAAFLAGEPARFKMRHQVESAFAGEEHVIDGFLVVERPERFFVHARSPLGPALFDVKSDSGELKVDVHMDALSDQRFARYLARDIERIYLIECPAAAPVEAVEGGFAVSCPVTVQRPAIGDDPMDDAVTLVIGPGGNIVQKRFSRAGAATATIDFEDYGVVDGVHLARRIHLRHASIAYRLSIALLDADVRFDTSKLFGPPRGEP